MYKFAEILFPLKLDRAFDYSIPEEFRKEIKVGCRVVAKFSNRKMVGIVWRMKDTSEWDSVSPILELIDSSPIVSSDVLQYYEAIAEKYLCPLGLVVKSALPSTAVKVPTKRLRLEDTTLCPDDDISKAIVELLERKGELSVRYIRRLIGSRNVEYVANKLCRLGVCSFFYDDVKVKKQSVERMIHCLEKSNDKLRELAQNLPSSAIRKKSLLYLLAENPDAVHNYSKLSKIFTGSTINSLIKDGIIEIIKQADFHFPFIRSLDDSASDFQLSEYQKNAVDKVTSEINNFNPHLLYGVSASGKTQVYIEIIRKVLLAKRKALYLVPEVSLIPQIYQRLRNSLKDYNIGIYHSYLTATEKNDIWKNIIDSHFDIILGVRSAIYSPIGELGVIIVDEEHSHSYKQSEPQPYYNARDVALMRAEMNKIPLILGSATPSIESYYKALNGEYELLILPERVVKGANLPITEIIDMKKEREKYKNFGILSYRLKELVNESLDRNEKVLLLLNRRGYSTSLTCQTCGYVFKCPSCQLPYTFHKRAKNLVCHWCDETEPAPSICPDCNSLILKFKGRGTERIEEELAELFPDIPIYRLDRDVATAKGGVSDTLSDFAKEGRAILIGTQMISQGLDIRDVTLVGVLNADIGLNIPDFRASEKAFQLLTQVAGRAGRGDKAGRVVIQTYQPESPAITNALEFKYNTFYTEIISERERLQFPPFSRLIYIQLNSKKKENLEEFTPLLKSMLNGMELNFLGPSPCPIEWMKGYSRYQVIIKSSDIETDMQKVKSLTIPGNIKFKIDIDPIDFM